MFRPYQLAQNSSSESTVESRRSSNNRNGKAKVLGRASKKSGIQTTKNRRCRRHGGRTLLGLTDMGRQQRAVGFLKGPPKPPAYAFTIICGTSRRWRNKESNAETSKKPKTEEPTSGTCPIIHMVVHHGQRRHPVTVLLDTGCSVPLFNEKMARRLQLRLLKHEEQRLIENFTGQAMEGAGEFYTDRLVLQHRRHFSREVMEVAPMDKEIDIFLPYWWIAKHPPQGAWENREVRFNSLHCLEKCTRYETNDLELFWDETVCYDDNVRCLGYISAITQEDPLDKVPLEFRQYMNELGKEMADTLPKHQPYNCKIELKEGSTAPWWPIYPLSETELQALREWVKEMERIGKIWQSTSLAGSPILFIPKPNGKGLHVCVDYRGLNKVLGQKFSYS